MTPTGIRIPDRGDGLTVHELRTAIKAVLTCLQFIHARRFVHRDLRWANIIKHASYLSNGTLESYHFLIIDFEFAACDGDAMMINNYIHGRIIPYGSSYHTLHDMRRLVGKLLEAWAGSNNQVLNPLALDFMYSATREDHPLDASAALQHAWLREL